MSNKAFVLVFLVYVSVVTSTLAPFITKCKSNDLKCHKESAQVAIPLFAAGIPELNVEKLDPLFLKNVDASTSNLKLTITDVTVTGLKNCEVKKIERDMEKLKIFVKVLCPSELIGKYVMKGQLFVLPIEGHGDLKVKVRKNEISVEVDIVDKIGKDGKNHWRVKSWKHTFELKDKSDVKFENLFPDNELLRNTTNELIATNGNDVIEEIGGPFIKAVVAKVVESIKNFFLRVPVEDLSVD